MNVLMGIKPTKKTAKTKDRNKVPAWGIRIPIVYRQILAELAKDSRRTLTEEAKIAFEEYFAKHGKWPRS